MEQLSQRAISPFKLQVVAPTPRLQTLVDNFIQEAAEAAKIDNVPPEDLREVFPQGVLVNLVIGANVRAFHHFFFMRSSPLYGGKGGAHKKFMLLADMMQVLAKEVYPLTMSQILPA
ncbi:hypothetical protein LCGC14_0918930 [marine sediment metagenome]|uniref:Uncharacterized protein n=1 Tax=marine sediment metagenome TaxID=412755 RepID=A0A0F9PC43_9ZZZZ